MKYVISSYASYQKYTSNRRWCYYIDLNDFAVHVFNMYLMQICPPLCFICLQSVITVCNF